MYVVTLDAACACSASEIGGKAMNLAKLARVEGVLVPPSICVHSDAFKEHIAGMGLPDSMQGITDIEAFSKLAKAKVEGKEMAPWVRDEIHGKLKGLRAPYAVRSSATLEDAGDHPFAGQQDTYLYTRRPDVLARVIKCWGSLYNDHALDYRVGLGVDEIGAISVVIQPMVDAKVSGVMMTINPVNGNRDEIVINSSWGLGPSIVSGHVTPDEYYRRKSDGAVLQTNISNKILMTIRDGGTDKEVPIEGPLATQPSLQEADVRKLVDLGTRIERYFGCPQDIEFAKNGSRMYIVQTRPVNMKNMPPGE